MIGELPIFGQQSYRPPGGTRCVPPGPFSSLQIAYPPRPNIASQNIIVGIGKFGDEVLKGFRDFNTVYRSGFNWEKGKTQLISLGNTESSGIILVNNPDELRTVLTQIGTNPPDVLRCILIADVTEAENQSVVSDIVRNSYDLQTRNSKYLDWHLLLNIAPTGSITSRRKQSVFLREIDFWSLTGYHTPRPGLDRLAGLINSAIILNEATGSENEATASDTAIKQAVLSLYSMFYKQSVPDAQKILGAVNPRDAKKVLGVRLRALGTPWLDLVNFFAIRLAIEWLVDGRGVFPAYKLTQELVNKTPHDDLRHTPVEVFLQRISEKINSCEDFSWVSAYNSIFSKLGKGSLGQILGFFDGINTYPHQLNEHLDTRLAQVQEKLREATQDTVFRWNIPEVQAINQANAFYQDYFPSLEKKNIFSEINSHVKIHCELGTDGLILLPLCVPSIVPTTYDYHQFAFPFPERLASFADALIKLFNDQIKVRYESLPALPPIDTSYNPAFFDDLQGVSGKFTDRKHFVFSSERTWPTGRNYCFPKTIKADILGIEEPDLIVGMIQDVGLNYQDFPVSNNYMSREGLHFDPHLKNAAFFESRDDFDDQEVKAPFCREIVMTCYDRNLVILFWKAFDRGIVFWKENKGWVIDLGNSLEKLTENVKDEFQILHKSADSLWDAFENFTVRKRANLPSYESVNPFGDQSFRTTITSLKNEIVVRQRIPEVVQWLSNEVRNKAPDEPKYSDMLRLFKICRAIPNQELL